MKDLNKLRRELAQQFDDQEKARRRAVIKKFARLRHNRVVFCTPSAIEISRGFGADRQGSNGKVIYDTLKQARAAAKELGRHGQPEMRAYVCHRSRRGHAHLTSKPSEDASDGL